VVVLQRDQPDEDHATGIFGTTRSGLGELMAFLRQHGVRHAAMESMAQYWRPVWMALEGQFALTLDRRARRGRRGGGSGTRRMRGELPSGYFLAI